MSLIPHLLDLLFIPRESEVLLRSTEETVLLQYLAPRAIGTTSPDTTVLLPFKEPLVRAAIHEAKYAHNKKAHRLLARTLEDYLLEHLSEHPHSILVPIPLSRKRFRERGFNQCERIIQQIKPATFPLATNLLFRERDTEHQTRLSGKERGRNIEHAFVAKPLSPKTTYLLIDDVITTGATMREAIATLRRAGARHIHPIALAH